MATAELGPVEIIIVRLWPGASQTLQSKKRPIAGTQASIDRCQPSFGSSPAMMAPGWRALTNTAS
jgi:hypothetical protein